jgi:four helix bundle protein
MPNSVLLDKSKEFAIVIIKTCRTIKETKREFVLTDQLIRSASSVGANIHESKYGHGNADFVAKMQIALKECFESEYWLELMNKTDYLSDDQYRALQSLCGSLRRMLIASINTAKSGNDKK